MFLVRDSRYFSFDKTQFSAMHCFTRALTVSQTSFREKCFRFHIFKLASIYRTKDTSLERYLTGYLNINECNN